MALTFYYMSGSQYSWRVWLSLEHKRIPYSMKSLSYDAGDLSSPEFTRLNPRRRVPVIVDGDFSLYESAAIVEYIEDNHQGGPRLFSSDLRERALQRRMIREVDQYFASSLDTLVRLVLLTSRRNWSEPAISKAQTELKVEFDHWERTFSGDFLCAGLSAVDFSLFPLVALLKRMNNRRADTWSAEMAGPRVTSWIGRMENLDLVQKTWPPHWRAAEAAAGLERA